MFAQAILPGAERAAFGFALLDSIWRVPDPDIEAAWAAEIARHAADDESAHIPAEQVFAELTEDISQR